ncbi:hypothetical protein P8C59_006331 [Phyllachora maydis]|uniref:Peptidyl-prolyl cis-trans isomerase n=1 Tax=Phyllachora maydis TaxID=1825666 RepID=A0AAD9I6A3_9PEZI|nr:hypothetical protein P8C59_006331 [Phyllachora maydis]
MSVTLHTNKGDLKIEVFCESVPKTAENFLALCASNYYDDSPFHRLIPSFMVQTGAPAHPSPENPKGGRSIFGPTFEDEIRGTLRHNERGIVSMANRGPGTNGSQFFILLDKAPHLDGLNTVFGKLLGDDSLRTLALIEQIERVTSCAGRKTSSVTKGGTELDKTKEQPISLPAEAEELGNLGCRLPRRILKLGLCLGVPSLTPWGMKNMFE